MHKIIGNEVTIFLKGTDSILGDITGVLLDVSEDSLYIQESPGGKTFVVPRDNVSYSTTDKVATEIPLLRQDHVHTAPQEYQEAPQEPQYQEPVQSPIDKLNVYVNKKHIASIPIPPTFRVDVWNENILRVLMGNPEVQNALAGKVQKGLEYFPGEVYIEVAGLTPPSQMPDNTPGYQTDFSMAGGPAEQYLSPLQMAARLNSVVKRGQGDGDTNL